MFQTCSVCPDSYFNFHEFMNLCLSPRVRPASQGDAHEPQSHHSLSDVRPPGRGHQRLDRWHLLHTLAENAESKERSWKSRTGRWGCELKKGTFFPLTVLWIHGSKHLPATSNSQRFIKDAWAQWYKYTLSALASVKCTQHFVVFLRIT